MSMELLRLVTLLDIQRPTTAIVLLTDTVVS